MPDPNRNGWYYRLLSPTIPIMGPGCLVQYDEFMCTLDYSCDYTDTKVRFRDSATGTWCPWINIDGYILYGGCFSWDNDRTQDVSEFYDDSADMVQFAWDLMDLSQPDDFCRGKHSKTDFLVDNVSVGFYDGHATNFNTRALDLLHDTFFGNICAHNSLFNEASSHDIMQYSGPPYDTYILPWEQQFVIDVTDKNGIQTVNLYGSIDQGQTWIDKPMTLRVENVPGNPSMGGTYSGTFCPDEFGLDAWPAGTEVWYHVRCVDGDDRAAYYPPEADPVSPDHTGAVKDYLDFSIFPLHQPGSEDTEILLVDAYQRDVYDWDPCLEDLSSRVPLRDIYESTLTQAGYSFERFDILGAGTTTQIQPRHFDAYDAVIWFTGPDLSQDLISEQTWQYMHLYLMDGGKVILSGDRLALYVEGNSFFERFVPGKPGWPIWPYGKGTPNPFGFEYDDEMPSGFEEPYIYATCISSIRIGRRLVSFDLGDVLIYRGCPFLRDMSRIQVQFSSRGWPSMPQFPLSRKNPQPLITIGPDPGNPKLPYYIMAIYNERGLKGGQVVFMNCDLSALVNQTTQTCGGNPPDPAPDYTPGSYAGRVEIMRAILKDLFGLDPVE